MKTPETTYFPKKIERFGWLLLMIMVAGSIPVHSFRLTLGIAIGGLISVLNFRMMSGGLANFFVGNMDRLKVSVVKRHYIRMAATALLLFMVISNNLVDIVGLLIGLSLIVIDITLTTVLAIFRKNTIEEH